MARQSGYCKCGRPTGAPDAYVCDICWHKGSDYSSPDRCGCGAPKYPDAAKCEACWRRDSQYD